MPVKLVDSGRAELRGPTSAGELEALAADPRLKVLQTSEPNAPSVWPLLDTTLFARRPDVELRVYGFYGKPCDLSFASSLRHVRRFAADCLMDATGVEHVARIPGLESLALGIYSLESFDVLRDVGAGLQRLILGETRSKRPSLAPLSRFPDLRTLTIAGHRKEIEVLAGVRSLEDLTLSSVTLDDLSFLRPLDRLWSLDLKLGGTKDLSGIAGMAGIKYLEIWRVLGLEDVSVAGQLPGLQFLFLESLKRVKEVPDLAAARSLRRIMLEGMKGLRSLATLEYAPALEELLLYDAAPLGPGDLAPVLRNRSLKRANAFFGSDRKNREARALLERHAIAECDRFQFEFR